MLWLFIACQDTPKNLPQKEVLPIKDIEKPVKKEPLEPIPKNTDTISASAPSPMPIQKNIDSAKQVVSHPSPLDAKKQQTIDICRPYYQLLEQESLRGTPNASEKIRLSSLKDLNRLLEYHPENTAQAIVELEKEVLSGPIHLSLQKRQEYWYSIHSYIGSICRADLSKVHKPKKAK